ncbi:MAG: Crp/Fnr family transcriptional regulator [Candidatus Latescibacteria bacterium]|jgi:CRP/FNR family transcriptional regulator|nr:Crp/Fnr family transcriptional regulator [Candidatus Latescibacterota bacterium]
MLDSPSSIQSARSVLEFLSTAGKDIETAFLEHADAVRVPAGQHIGLEGNPCSALAFVVSGSARVYKTGETGREITLYRVEPGETCILTASCILNEELFPAFAITETDVEAAAVPAQVFRRWTDRHPFWRDYVFRLISHRMATIIAVVEEVAFRRVDVRLAEFLAGASDGPDDPIRRTHQQIASELGTSREVVSRILKDFEREGLLSLSRSSVQVLDPAALGERQKNA